jgi:hypothetical protein
LNYESRQVYDRMAGLGFILLLVLINTPVWSVFNRMIGGIYGVLQLLYGLG